MLRLGMACGKRGRAIRESPLHVGLRGEGNLVGGDFLEGFYVEAALGGLDAISEGFEGIVGADGDLSLGENGAVVVDFVDEVHGDAGGAEPGFQDGAVDVVAVHAPAAEFREQSGVGVDDAVVKSAEGFGAQELHVSREDYEVDLVVQKSMLNGGVEGFGGWMRTGTQMAVGDGVKLGSFEGDGG